MKYENQFIKLDKEMVKQKCGQEKAIKKIKDLFKEADNEIKALKCIILMVSVAALSTYFMVK